MDEELRALEDLLKEQANTAKTALAWVKETRALIKAGSLGKDTSEYRDHARRIHDVMPSRIISEQYVQAIDDHFFKLEALL
jgi:hypothetical protein